MNQLDLYGSGAKEIACETEMGGLIRSFFLKKLQRTP